MLHADASRMRNFWTIRQEKSLALTRILQCTAERSWALTQVLCDAAQELQKCMAPLMCLYGDEIVEASSWSQQVTNLGPPPPWRRKLPSWGEEQELPEAPEANASLQEHQETPKSKEHTKQIDVPSTPALQDPAMTHPRKRYPSTGLSPKGCQPQCRHHQ